MEEVASRGFWDEEFFRGSVGGIDVVNSDYGGEILFF